MTQEQAMQLVKAHLEDLGLEEDMEPVSARRVIVEYKKDPGQPGPTQDRVAWAVRCVSCTAESRVYLDDQTSQVLRVSE